MEALRTVTDTFTVNFKNPAAGNCEEASDAIVFLLTTPDDHYTYIIDGNSTPLSILPEFVAMSVDCPAICTIYEGYNSENPSSLPEASDPSFYSFNKFTGELVVKTKNVAYSGNVIPLTVECVANRQFMGYFSYAFQLDFNIPNGCAVTFNYSNSIISDQMLVWGEQKTVPAFNTYTYNSHNVCDGYTITYDAV
jgi:hypothetical protein